MIEVSELTRFVPSEKTLRLVMEIAAALERYRIVMEGPSGVYLRKLNHIRTIRGTTAIEGNTLSEEEVTAIIAGKRVAGSRREIDEIKGAHAAYSKISEFNPLDSSALLKAHAIMTKNLVKGPGKWRKCNVGVFNARGEAMHHAPPWDHVPFLMNDLFKWLKRSKEVPLVKSCIFHFVFETIHPFSDGNGRIGRFWQTVILGKWNRLFYALPIENMVLTHQRKYYKSLNESQKKSDAGAFVDFMLDMIFRTLKAKGDLKGGKKKVVSKGGKKTTEKLIEMMRKNPKVTLAEMVSELGISRSAIQKHIRRLKDAQIVRRVGPDKGGEWRVV
jgi:Fic family protein